MNATALTIGKLETLLDAKKTELERLAKKRDRLQAQLRRVESKMSRIEGNANGRTAAGVKRPSNSRSLRETVLDILSKRVKGFDLQQLAARVMATGYKSHSNDFPNVLYQCLYTDDVAHDKETGRYRLKAARNGHAKTEARKTTKAAATP